MPRNPKIRVELAYSVFLETMEDEGYCYYDALIDVPAESTWVEILRTGEDYDVIVYAVPQPEWKEIKDA